MNEKIKNLLPEAALAIYDGYSFFSMFKGQKRVYDAVTDIMKPKDSSKRRKVRIQTEEEMDGFSRCLAFMLKLPTIADKLSTNTDQKHD